ncbi:TGF beta receptor associated protein 1 [Histoplasma capsulatum H143]|uniref:TGF beta receptor associated protein 1 n=1 Tax=Ajellomyces capsulatus (strain H143) TaxID=544712 RepID=C6HNR8_AJECH|nr:TGF beta receptor associated protein 1 [Histoplasma capsulatum H143]
MSSDDDTDNPRKRRRIAAPETSPYVLRELIDSVPVAGDGAEQDAYITCVEYWNDNLYIGTSAGEVLHFVSFPSDSQGLDEPSFILASRLSITPSQSSLPPDTPLGVQQILILPSTYKACILCNGVVTFYSLPELSPTYGTTKVGNCKWIGGLDLNESHEGADLFDPVVMIAVSNRIMLVRIGDEPRRESYMKNRTLPGSPGSPEKKSPGSSGPSSENGGPGSDGSSPLYQKPLPTPPPKQSTTRLKPHVVSPTASEFLLVTGTEPSEPGVGMFVNVEGDVVRGTLEFRKYPMAIVVDDDSNEGNHPRTSDENQNGYVLAVISADDDEDSRTYLEVQRWNAVPGERRLQKASVEIPSASPSPGAVGIRRSVGASRASFSEIVEVMRMVRLKLSSVISPTIPSTPLENSDPRTRASLEHLQKERELFDNQDTDSEGPKHPSSSSVNRDWEAQRNQEEAKFARGLATVNSSILLWEGNKIWRVLRNPLALQLENSLELAKQTSSTDGNEPAIDREAIIGLIQGLQDMEPKTETEYIGLRYVRQKASLLLFVDLLSANAASRVESTIKSTEDALVAGELDPRVVLLLIPLLKDEVLQGPQGIWVYNGLVKVISSRFSPPDVETEHKLPNFRIDDDILHMIRRYLLGWQKKRGYGSVTDETVTLIELCIYSKVTIGFLCLADCIRARKWPSITVVAIPPPPPPTTRRRLNNPIYLHIPSNQPSYSISAVLARIEPFKNELVSENIILDGRQGRHREALRLLTHGLSDYDTAIRYCAYGGPTWSAPPTTTTSDTATAARQAELFTYLLTEFLQIADPVCRAERTSDLLARFASVYDIADVLRLVPDEWSVDILSEYLKLESIGGWVEGETGVRALKGSGEVREDVEHEGDNDGERYGGTPGDLVGGIIVDGDGILR